MTTATAAVPTPRYTLESPPPEVLSQLPSENGGRLFTEADLAALPSDLPSGAVRWELDNGRLIAMPPPGDIHGAIDSNINAALKVQGEWRGLGKARTEVGGVLWRNPDRVVGPDGVFITNASLPLRHSREGYLETIPELIVEVRSKNDTLPEILRKIADYFRAGVRVVWVPDPRARIVTEYRPDVEPRVYHEDDSLTIEDVIPGFQLLVRTALQE
jgi:Uma2 family endonuclease